MKVSTVLVPQDSETCLAHFTLRCTTKEMLWERVQELLHSLKERKGILPHEMEKYTGKAFVIR